MSQSLRARQQPDGLWYPNLDDPGHIPSRESSGTGFFVYGMAWGINNGLLSRETYWPHIEKGWQGLLDCVQESGMLGYVQPVGASPENNIKPELTQLYGTGAFLMAGTEIMKLLGASEFGDTAQLLDQAEALAFAAGEKEALAVYQPYRKDDVAWENDVMAFRVYGPALAGSVEDSGIDCWMKSVPTPVIRKWYADDFAGRKSYHTDHGEGYDGYKVGAARGCGGTALYKDGKLETSNVWRSAHILWTRRDEAKIALNYHYKDSDIWERKTVSLKVGDRFCEVDSLFQRRPGAPGIGGLEVAVGLTAQTDGARFSSSKADGLMAVWDELPNGDEIGTGVLIDSDTLKDFQRAGSGSGSEILAVLSTDGQGRIRYRMGFTWIRGSLPANIGQWSEFLSGSRQP